MATERKKPGKKPLDPPVSEKELNQLYNYCLLGATNENLAAYYGVHLSTIDKWIRSVPAFASVLKSARDEADAKVVKSLFQRAIGYDNPNAVKIFYDRQTGLPVYAKYTEHTPPDVTAIIFWLKNRQRVLWRDRQDLDVTGTGANVTLNIDWTPAPGCQPLKPIEDIEKEAAKEEEELNKPDNANNDKKEA